MQSRPSLSLVTPRLTVRALRVDDLEPFVAYRQDADVARYQGWDPSFSMDDGRALVLQQPSAPSPPPGGWLQLALLAKDGALVGDMALHTLESPPNTFEVGVTLAPSYQGSGLATEGLGAVLEHLFTSAGAQRVIAVCDARNTAIARLLLRVGLQKETSEGEAEFFKGEWVSLDTYAMSSPLQDAD